MSRVIECDICGDTYEKRGVAAKFGRIEAPFRYKVWKVLPRNRDRVGFVKKDICSDCRGNFEKAVRMLKEANNE